MGGQRFTLQDVSSINIGGWPRGTYVRIASTTIEDVTHDSLFKSVHISDSCMMQTIVSLVDELSQVPVECELDLRKVIFIHLKNGETISIGLGETSGTLFNGNSIRDNETLFEIADSILYLSQSKDFWVPEFLK